jgi:serine protease
LPDYEFFPKIKGKNDSSFLYPVGTILVLPKNRVSINEILAKFKNRLEQFSPPFEGFYTLVPKKAEEVISLANEVFESDLVEWSHPNFSMPIYKTYIPNDPAFANQYYLNSNSDIDINVPQAWDITEGSPTITVAVIDDGVEAHPDLQDANGNSRVLQGFHRPTDNMFYPGGQPMPDANLPNVTLNRVGHGESVSGIIAATTNNGIGASGIAPRVKILPINIFYDWVINVNGRLIHVTDVIILWIKKGIKKG